MFKGLICLWKGHDWKYTINGPVSISKCKRCEHWIWQGDFTVVDTEGT